MDDRKIIQTKNSKVSRKEKKRRFIKISDLLNQPPNGTACLSKSKMLIERCVAKTVHLFFCVSHKCCDGISFCKVV